MKNSRILLNLLTLAALSLAGNAIADELTKEGYMIDSSGNVVRDRYNGCVRTSSWTPEKAIMECDPDLVKKAEPEVVAPAPAPEPEPAPAPAPAPEPVVEAPKPAPTEVAMQAETLFDFNQTVLTDAGRKILDAKVISQLKQYKQIDSIRVTGHADRIGSEANNRKISQLRAEAVKDYLVTQGVDANRIIAESKGSTEPLVACDSVAGPAVPGNQQLVSCLQPNRRVEVVVTGLQ